MLPKKAAQSARSIRALFLGTRDDCVMLPMWQWSLFLADRPDPSTFFDGICR